MNDKHQAGSHRPVGFTLIELLTVMAIMVIMSGITIGSYFALMRGAGLRAAVDTVRNTLLLARQSAIMESKQAYVLFGQSADTTWCMLCMHEGTVTGVGGGSGLMFDRYGDLSRVQTGSVLYNLSVNPVKSGQITVLQRDADGVWNVRTPGVQWAENDCYGWARGSQEGMPRGFSYGNSSPELPETVIFKSDGSVRTSGYTIPIYENINSNYVVRIQVEKMTGFVKVIYP